MLLLLLLCRTSTAVAQPGKPPLLSLFISEKCYSCSSAHLQTRWPKNAETNRLQFLREFPWYSNESCDQVKNLLPVVDCPNSVCIKAVITEAPAKRDVCVQSGAIVRDCWSRVIGGEGHLALDPKARQNMVKMSTDMKTERILGIADRENSSCSLEDSQTKALPKAFADRLERSIGEGIKPDPCLSACLLPESHPEYTMKENVQSSPYVADRQAPSLYSLKNKHIQEEKSPITRTSTTGRNKRERIDDFGIDEAISGSFNRSRSSDSRRRMYKVRDDTRRICSYSVLSASCKLPSVTNTKSAAETRTCTMRPWSRTQEELRKYKELLK
ncbi:hypothetical protein KIN20_005142 [Parelaphostrongylus tenuis]|uniref:Uncharacterized protein n=1 Tax=Parelaphostrongylus tenuis TaxID=148309 RepID=A0AAD5MIE5_PARTN|nr:hypothetical protein KIN20_005142 [Parelaphostrongylus tenuis]